MENNTSLTAVTGQNEKVSVIIPTYNRGHLIQRAIRSVFDQTYTNLELIVVNDNSTDDTEIKVKEIKDERLIYLKNNNNCGPSTSRNKGIAISSGRYIAFLDSDDYWYSTKVEKQLKVLEESDQNIGVAYCGMEYFDFVTGSKTGESLFQADFKKNFTTGSFLLTPANVTLFIKKEVVDKVGGFDEKLWAHEDTELTIRISRKYSFVLVHEILVGVTRNHEQLMINNFNYIKASEIIYEKHKDFLSKKILFSLCKQIANYYILTNKLNKAEIYINYALRHKPSDIKIALQFAKTILQLCLLKVFPSFLKSMYNRKYQGEIPLTSGLKNPSDT